MIVLFLGALALAEAPEVSCEEPTATYVDGLAESPQEATYLCLIRPDEALEPLVARIRSGLFHLRKEPGAELLVPVLQHRKDQIVFRREVLIERHFGNARLCQDLVDARCIEAALIEKAEGCFDEVVPT